MPLGMDGLLMELELSVLPMEGEAPPIGAEALVSGIGAVTAGAVLAGVLGMVSGSTFLPQAASASMAVSAAMVRGVRKLIVALFMVVP
jgi:hypothetical protein